MCSWIPKAESFATLGKFQIVSFASLYFPLIGNFFSLFQLFILPCFSIKQFPWKLVKINDNSYFILSSTIRHRIEWSLWSQWYRQYTSTVQNVGNTGQASDRHNYNRGGECDRGDDYSHLIFWLQEMEEF